MVNGKSLSEIFIEDEVPKVEPKPKEQKSPAGKNKRFLPKEGYAWNPLFSMMERNEPCLCGSGNKWKRCCMPKQPRVVKKHVADGMFEKVMQMKCKNAGIMVGTPFDREIADLAHKSDDDLKKMHRNMLVFGQPQVPEFKSTENYGPWDVE